MKDLAAKIARKERGRDREESRENHRAARVAAKAWSHRQRRLTHTFNRLKTSSVAEAIVYGDGCLTVSLLSLCEQILYMPRFKFHSLDDALHMRNVNFCHAFHDSHRPLNSKYSYLESDLRENEAFLKFEKGLQNNEQKISETKFIYTRHNLALNLEIKLTPIDTAHQQPS